MRLFQFLLFLIFQLAPVIAFGQSVPPEILALCERRWGADYEMRVLCHEKQFEAKKRIDLESLSGKAVGIVDRVDLSILDGFRIFQAGGLLALNNEVGICYYNIRKDTAHRCISMDILANLLADDESGRNSSVNTVNRTIEKSMPTCKNRDECASMAQSMANIVVGRIFRRD